MNPTRTYTRYMSFATFASTLARGLFMRKASAFDDELEGVLPYLGDTSTQPIIPRESIKRYLDWVYVSCWYAEPVESHAMWQLYGRSAEAIAIQTTERYFRMAYFDGATRMQTYLDDVRYTHPGATDFRLSPNILVLQKNEEPIQDGLAVYAALFSYLKHSAYSYEKEARLVIIDKQANGETKNPMNGHTMPATATREMIQEVILHPAALPWFRDLVAETLNHYGVNANVRTSSLAGNGQL